MAIELAHPTLVERIDAAIQRIVDGSACMRIPADLTDPDLVLADCKRVIAQAEGLRPIDMVLNCPRCGQQHIDAPETTWKEALIATGRLDAGQPAPEEVEAAHVKKWTNPPHRSHLCGECGWIWRPADVPTNGVAAVLTRGANDSAAS